MFAVVRYTCMVVGACVITKKIIQCAVAYGRYKERMPPNAA